MIQKHRDIVYKYWGRTELGKQMIVSDNVSDSDLLFLIPNNVKRRIGLPLTRITGKKKRKQKESRKKNALSFGLFDIIEEIIEETIGKQVEENDFFEKLVEVKDLGLGDKNIFIEKQNTHFIVNLEVI